MTFLYLTIANFILRNSTRRRNVQVCSMTRIQKEKMLMLQGDDKGAAEARAPWRGERTERAGGENKKEVRRGREERREPALSSPISCGEAAGGGLASGAAHGGGWKSADGRRTTATTCASASGWKVGDLRIAEERRRRRPRSAGSESTASSNARKTEPVEVPPPRETVRTEGRTSPGLEYHGRVLVE
jgi:hypothetical protein